MCGASAWRRPGGLDSTRRTHKRWFAWLSVSDGWYSLAAAVAPRSSWRVAAITQAARLYHGGPLNGSRGYTQTSLSNILVSNIVSSNTQNSLTTPHCIVCVSGHGRSGLFCTEGWTHAQTHTRPGGERTFIRVCVRPRPFGASLPRRPDTRTNTQPPWRRAHGH